jgi:hypothetical protein
VQYKGTHPKTALDYIHRTTNEQEIYFVTNRFGQMKYNDFEYRYLPTLPDRYEQVECSFRVSGKVPESWNPVTGETEEIMVYREENGRTIIPLHFEPEGSKFVIFRDAVPQRHITGIEKDGQAVFPGFSFKVKEYPFINFAKKGEKICAEINEPGIYTLNWSDGHSKKLKAVQPNQTIEFSGDWEIGFDTQWGAPAKVKANQLKSWTEFDESGIKYYSGTATYKKSFELKRAELKQKRLLLDLGNVKEMASLKINGNQLQVLWCAPFRFDITPFVKVGTNELEVEVVNMWVNRLIGDGKLPLEKRLTKTNINKFDAADAEKYLRVSGLLGPVSIRLVKENRMK